MPKSRKRPGRDLPGRASPNLPRNKVSSTEGAPVLGSGSARSSGRGLDRRSKGILIGLMLSMFLLFLIIAWVAPDTTQADGKPTADTVVARTLLLLSLLGITYVLLVWDRVVKFFKRLRPKSGH